MSAFRLRSFWFGFTHRCHPREGGIWILIFVPPSSMGGPLENPLDQGGKSSEGTRSVPVKEVPPGLRQKQPQQASACSSFIKGE